MIIVNADDFGYSELVNKAIDLCFRNKIISSTTIMMNMPYVGQAIELAKEHGYSHCIGLHFNLIEGRALSEPIKFCPRLCDKNGNFIYKRNSVFRWSYHEKLAIIEELRTQLEELIKWGITPTHVDSHQHVHTEWPIYRVIKNCLRENHIHAIRISRNIGGKKLRNLYKFVFNNILTYDGFKITRYFGAYTSFDKRMNEKETLELMCHPVMYDGQIIDSTSKEVIEKKFDCIYSYNSLLNDRNK